MENCVLWLQDHFFPFHAVLCHYTTSLKMVGSLLFVIFSSATARVKWTMLPHDSFELGRPLLLLIVLKSSDCFHTAVWSLSFRWPYWQTVKAFSSWYQIILYNSQHLKFCWLFHFLLLTHTAHLKVGEKTFSLLLFNDKYPPLCSTSKDVSKGNKIIF